MFKVVIIESMSASSLFMMVRGANFPSITSFKYTGIFQLFKVKLIESCVFRLGDLFRTKVKGDQRQDDEGPSAGYQRLSVG